MKKEKLKELILKSDYSYDLLGYKLICNGCLDNTISKIDNVDVVSNIDKDDITCSDEQFLTMLDMIIITFKSHYPNMKEYTDYAILNILNSNSKNLQDFLLSKHYAGDNEYIGFFQQSVLKILIENFISNAKHIKIIRDLLENQNIKLKDINSYSLQEIISIDKLLSKIVLCNSNSFHLMILFSNIDYELCEMQSINSERKESVDEMLNAICKHYNTHLNIVIKNYLKRRKYVKYFIS